MAQYTYMANYGGKIPHVIRCGKDLVWRGYNPRLPGKWHESIFYDAFVYGGGSFMDYDDCTEEDAIRFMKEADQEYEKWKAEASESEKKEYYDSVMDLVKRGVWRIPDGESPDKTGDK